MKKRKLWIILPVAALLVCIVLVLYTYTPVFVPDEPLAEFPACLERATSVKLKLYGYEWEYNKEIRNRFKVEAMAEGIQAALGEETESVAGRVDGGFTFQLDFCRGKETICSLQWSDHGNGDFSRYRLLMMNGEQQWFVWLDPKLMQSYVALVKPEYAEAFWKE